VCTLIPINTYLYEYPFELNRIYVFDVVVFEIMDIAISLT